MSLNEEDLVLIGIVSPYALMSNRLQLHFHIWHLYLSLISAFHSCRYLEESRDQLEEEEEEVQKKLEPAALSCYLNTAACKLKMQLWQDAVEGCNQVRVATLGLNYCLPSLRISTQQIF